MKAQRAITIDAWATSRTDAIHCYMGMISGSCNPRLLTCRIIANDDCTMTFRPLPAKAPIALLRDAKPLQAMLDQAMRLGRLQALVDEQLEATAREHCRVASWREGCLLLLTSNGHWATRLHYQQRRLLRQLQALPEFVGLLKIQIKVRPPSTQTHHVARTAELSSAAAESLHSAAEGISDPKLRAALERLASKAKPRG